MEFSTQNVAHALNTLYTSSDAAQKEQADKFLSAFQKGLECWAVTREILEGEFSQEAKTFSAQTLATKIQLDFYQVPQESREELKLSLIQLLQQSIQSRLVSRHLSIALANLAVQYTAWHDAIPEMANKFSSTTYEMASLLEFLRVLPEEMSDSKKSPLSDEEFRERSKVLVEDNAMRVVELLANCTSNNLARNDQVFECLNSWIKEISVIDIGKSPLIQLMFDGLNDDETFEPAVACLETVIKETKDVMETQETIAVLYPRIVALRPRISQTRDDPETFRGLTKLFSSAGEAWHVLVAQKPQEFRQLAECIAECTAFDEDLEVVQYTFYFWYELKNLLTHRRYAEAKNQLSDIYEELVDIMIHHLRYPDGEDHNNLFDDKEEEERFRSFRHEMGDLLKDCCSVIGSQTALEKAYNHVFQRLHTEGSVWQDIEAPLFSMRAMAREVNRDEEGVLPNVMRLLVQLPEHEKIRYAATLVLGRYTGWTAKHPEYLSFQLEYITKGFESTSSPVMNAAAQALMYFCQDCAPLLTGYLNQFHPFYEKIASELDLSAMYEVTDGFAHVIAAQPDNAQVLSALQHFSQPIIKRLLAKTNEPGSQDVYRAIADEIEYLTIFVSIVEPKRGSTSSVATTTHPISATSQFVIDLYPNLVVPILAAHGTSSFVAERTSKFVKTCVHTCDAELQPILPQIAETLVHEFERTQFGCYLWVSGSLVREYGDESRSTNTPEVHEAVWHFAYQQSQAFFRHLSSSSAKDLPDLVEDFFRLMNDVLMYMPYKHILSDIFAPSFEAALASLTLEKAEPLSATLHFLQDILGFGKEAPPMSFPSMGGADGVSQKSESNVVPPNVRERVIQLAMNKGQVLCGRVIIGLIYSFPRDCVIDASSLILSLTQLVHHSQALQWITQTIDMLPEGTVSEQERANLLSKVDTAMQSGDYKRVRALLRDFTALYARRNMRSNDYSVLNNLGSQFTYND